MVPAFATDFKYEHSRKWSSAIAAFDGYIFVSPEYNMGIPGGAKNAIDYLYHAWIGKPVLIITYGIKGGKTANAQLKDVLTCMKLKVVETRPQLTFRGEGMAEVGLAGGQGVLGPETKKDWEDATTESGKDILKGYGELIELLNAPAPGPANAA
jgi:NAD(P)H-dependent FMN reductase